jgi:hypothetical protein
VLCGALYDWNSRIVHLTNDLAFSSKQLETLQGWPFVIRVSFRAGVLNSYTIFFSWAKKKK